MTAVLEPETVETEPAVEDSFDEEKMKRRYKDMVNTDPFADVRLNRAKLYDGSLSKKYHIEMQDKEGTWRELSSTETVHGDRYRLIKNMDMHNMVQSVIDNIKKESGLSFEVMPGIDGSTRGAMVWTGTSYAERWFTRDVNVKLASGGTLMMAIEARNSYDRASKAEIAFYGLHLTCYNQLRSSNLFGRPFSVSHIFTGGDNSDGIDTTQIIAQVTANAANFGNCVAQLDKMIGTRLDTTEKYLDFLDRCEMETRLSLNDKKLRECLNGRGPVSKSKLLGGTFNVKEYGDRDSVFALVNAYSEINSHATAGMSGISNNERFLDFSLGYCNSLNEPKLIEAEVQA